MKCVTENQSQSKNGVSTSKSKRPKSFLILSRRQVLLMRKALIEWENCFKNLDLSKSFAFALIMTVSLCGSGLSATTGTASWYSSECCKYNPDPKCPTASGRSLYDLEKNGEKFAASYAYPLGSKLKVTDRHSGRSVTVTVRDRGPNKRLGRLIDLSKSSFKEIAPLSKGLTEVKVEKL